MYNTKNIQNRKSSVFLILIQQFAKACFKCLLNWVIKRSQISICTSIYIIFKSFQECLYKQPWLMYNCTMYLYVIMVALQKLFTETYKLRSYKVSSKKSFLITKLPKFGYQTRLFAQKSLKISFNFIQMRKDSDYYSYLNFDFKYICEYMHSNIIKGRLQ